MMQPFTLPDLLNHNLSERADKIAVIHGEQTVTYSELARDVERWAGKLAALGVEKGDRVCVHLPKSIVEVVVTLAVSVVGGVFTNVNTLVSSRMLAHALRDSGAKILVTSRRKATELVEQGCPDSLESIIADDVREFRCPIPTHAWEDVPEHGCSGARLIDKDNCAIIYTSGSTGAPKGVLLSHATVIQSARAAATHLSNNVDDRILGVLPLSFDYGLSQLTTMLLVGGTLVLPKANLPVELLNSIDRGQVNGLAMVPTMWIPFVRLLNGRGIVLDQLRYVANSGGPLPTDVQRAWPVVFPEARHYLMYGMTEGFRSTYLPPADFERKMGSIGLPLPNVEIFVVHPDKGLCDAFEHGELLHRGSLLSRGYYGNTSATEQKIRPSSHLQHLIGDEPVLHSEDTVYRDNEGYLWFVARTSTFIKCSDFRISPTEVEDIVFSSGLVTDVVAFGAPDESLGQVVRVVANSSNDEPLQKDALHRYCRKNMPFYMVPREIHEWPTEMPRTANGKIDRPKVIAAYNESERPSNGNSTSSRVRHS